MKTIKNHIRKVFAISQWLKQNSISYSRTSGSVSSLEDRKKLAEYYVEQLNEDIHDVKVFLNGENKPCTEFYVRVGNPKFRGSVNYNLHSHSLRFQSIHPMSVSLVLSGDINPASYDNSIKSSLASFRHDISKEAWNNLFKKIAVHPHIAEQGEPCLGGWATAFGTCVATGNILSLKNVAQSFLNTWTADDAFYNINHKRREWLRIPSSIRKYYSFKDWLVLQAFWQGIKYMLDRRHDFLNPVRFIDWLREKEDSILSYLSMYGFKKDAMIELHMKWGAVIASRKHTFDTSDGFLKRLDMHNRISYNTYESISARLSHGFNMRENITWCLAGDALYANHRPTRLYTPLSYEGDTIFPMREVISAIDYIRNYSGRRTELDVSWELIFNLNRDLNRGRSTHTESFISKEDIKTTWMNWFSNRYYKRAFWDSLNSSIDYANLISTSKHIKWNYFNWMDFLDKPFCELESAKVDNVFETMYGLEIEGENFLSLPLRRDHYVRIAIDIYIKQLEAYKGELENAEERKETVQDNHSRDYSSQDSVSIESL